MSNLLKQLKIRRVIYNYISESGKLKDCISPLIFKLVLAEKAQEEDKKRAKSKKKNMWCEKRPSVEHWTA